MKSEFTALKRPICPLSSWFVSGTFIFHAVLREMSAERGSCTFSHDSVSAVTGGVFHVNFVQFVFMPTSREQHHAD